MEVATNITEVALKVEDLKRDSVEEIISIKKLEEVNLEAEENSDVQTKAEDKFKRNSLSRFFKLRGVSSVSSNPDIAGGIEKVPKTSTLSRLFSKKEKNPEKGVTGSEASPRRSFTMRGLVVPWLSIKSSQTNLHANKSLAVNDLADLGDETTQEVSIASETF